MTMEYIKGTFCFITFVSWAYTTTALIACQSADLPYPDWFYPACTVAVVTFFILLGCLVYDILTSEVPHHRSRRAKRRESRCMGVIRYAGGRWMCIREDREGREEREER